jgi:putative transposase
MALKKRERKIAYLQKKLARQDKKSNARKITKMKLGKIYKKNANVTTNFCHQTSHQVTKEPGKIIVLENLKTKQITKRPKAIKDVAGKYLPNKAAQKAGLNRAILRVGWYKLENFIKYKAYRRGCCLIKISPQYTSQ